MTRARTATPSSAAGERKLPGGRAALLVSIALITSCAAPAMSPAARVASPAPVPPVAEAAAAVPMLGTQPPSGLVLPSYFVAVTSSDNGAISVLTAPASRCGLIVARPSGATADAGERLADASGIASWVYPPLPDHGVSIVTVRCSLGDQTQTAQAQVLLP
jgi:hypothetical protein